MLPAASLQRDFNSSLLVFLSYWPMSFFFTGETSDWLAKGNIGKILFSYCFQKRGTTQGKRTQRKPNIFFCRENSFLENKLVLVHQKRSVLTRLASDGRYSSDTTL